jgi:hypothetical protein
MQTAISIYNFESSTSTEKRTMTMTTANAIKSVTNSVSLTSVEFGSKKASSTGVFSLFRFAITNLATELGVYTYTPTAGDILTLTFTNPFFDNPTQCFVKAGLRNSAYGPVTCTVESATLLSITGFDTLGSQL